MSEHRERFNNLTARFNRVTIAPEDEPLPPDPEDVVAHELQVWASAAEVKDTFIPWLEARIDALDDMEAESARDHPSLLLAKGRRLEAKYIRSMFHQWRGTTGNGPDKEK